MFSSLLKDCDRGGGVGRQLREIRRRRVQLLAAAAATRRASGRNWSRVTIVWSLKNGRKLFSETAELARRAARGLRTRSRCRSIDLLGDPRRHRRSRRARQAPSASIWRIDSCWLAHVRKVTLDDRSGTRTDRCCRRAPSPAAPGCVIARLMFLRRFCKLARRSARRTCPSSGSA